MGTREIEALQSMINVLQRDRRRHFLPYLQVRDTAAGLLGSYFIRWEHYQRGQMPDSQMSSNAAATIVLPSAKMHHYRCSF